MIVYFNLVSALRMSACTVPLTRVPLWRACLPVNFCERFVPVLEELFFFLSLIEGNAVDKWRLL